VKLGKKVTDYRAKIKKVHDSFKTSSVPDYTRWKLAKIKQSQEQRKDTFHLIKGRPDSTMY